MSDRDGDDVDDASMTCWGPKKRKGKMMMSDLDLLHYYETKLGSGSSCSCKTDCLRILDDQVICSAVANYLVSFERKSKREQDNIILQWIIYGRHPGGRHSLCTSHHNQRRFGYHVPFDGLCLGDDGESLEKIRSHHFSELGLQFVMGTGRRRMKTIRAIAKTTAVMPLSRDQSKCQRNAGIKVDDPQLAPLLAHLDYLLDLGEVRATRVVTTLVDGIQGHANREDTIDQVYLPISMGYRSCYKR